MRTHDAAARGSMRTKEQEQARYRWPSPAVAGVRIGGVSPEHVIRLIKDGALRARDVSRPKSKRPEYRVDPDSIEEFNRTRMVAPGGE